MLKFRVALYEDKEAEYEKSIRERDFVIEELRHQLLETRQCENANATSHDKYALYLYILYIARV